MQKILSLTDLSGGQDVVLGAEVDAVLGLLHPPDHGTGQVDSPVHNKYLYPERI